MIPSETRAETEPALSRVVAGSPSRRLPGRDPGQVRPVRRRSDDGCRARPPRLRTLSATRSDERSDDSLREASSTPIRVSETATSYEHAHRPFRLHRCAQGAQLRARPKRNHPARRRFPQLRPADLPDPAAELPRLQALLPLHHSTPARQAAGTHPTSPKPAGSIARSGTRGMHVTVLTRPVRTGIVMPRYIVQLLDRLGYKATRKALLVHGPRRSPFLRLPQKHADLLGAWFADYPSAADFIQPHSAAAEPERFRILRSEDRPRNAAGEDPRNNRSPCRRRPMGTHRP